MINSDAIPAEWKKKATPYLPLLVQIFQAEQLYLPAIYAFACATICKESSWNPNAENTKDRAALADYNYRGRGLAQITWKNNYEAISNALQIDFLNQPDLMFQPELSLRAKAAYLRINYQVLQFIEAGDYESAAGFYNTGKSATRSPYTQKVSGDTYLWLPVFSDAPFSHEETTFPPEQPAHRFSENTYHVQAGDTFFAIARKFSVSVDSLKAANPQIGDFGSIQVGQAITIPS
jgi:LysM repeat protein